MSTQGIDESLQGREITYQDGVKVPFRQVFDYGCGSYSLANLFNKKEFITGAVIPGERTCDMNKKMQQHLPEYFIETLFLGNEHTIHNRLTDSSLLIIVPVDSDKEVYGKFARPMLFISFRPEMKLMHYFVVIHNMKNDLYYVIDSKQDKIMKFTIADLLNFYWVIGVEYFGEWAAEFGSQLLIEKTEFSHIFPEGE